MLRQIDQVACLVDALDLADNPALQALVEALDAFEEDPDLEENGDAEPACLVDIDGWTCKENVSQEGERFCQVSMSPLARQACHVELIGE